MTQDQKDNLIQWLRQNRSNYNSDVACFRAGVEAIGIPIQASSAQACAYFRLVKGKKPYYNSVKAPVKTKSPDSNGSSDLVTAIQSLEAQRVEHDTKIAEIDSILADLRNVLTASNR